MKIGAWFDEDTKKTWGFLTLWCIMSQNGQTRFNNLAANAARFFNCVGPFWDIISEELSGTDIALWVSVYNWYFNSCWESSPNLASNIRLIQTN